MNIIENLPKHWKIQIFTSANNTSMSHQNFIFLFYYFDFLLTFITDFVKTILKKYYDSGKVLIDGTILGNTTSLTRESYNNLLVTEELWKKFIADKVLMYL